jgi:hypothetical protein
MIAPLRAMATTFDTGDTRLSSRSAAAEYPLPILPGGLDAIYHRFFGNYLDRVRPLSFS